LCLRRTAQGGSPNSDPHDALLEQEYMKSEMVMKMALVKSRRKVMASSSKLTVQRERERFEGC